MSAEQQNLTRPPSAFIFSKWIHAYSGAKQAITFLYTFRTSNFGSARGGAGVSDKGFASMELA
ncbi:hypothetical protein EQU24_05760 [Methylotuvimicrobium buryatense]|uniref:Uncharacterized protein n=1 Tax=Methylotuvimicrobium buryatense TaxID=95641 RepID=A0A4P9UKW8_METBY|nr:hypothetical protein EQU24_05760 [Methylotuvimicrobium buryatense]